MPALVPSTAGVAIDERVHNLMHQRGHENLLVSGKDDPDLQAKVLVALNRLQTQRESIRDAIGRTVVENLKLMARMGVLLEQNDAWNAIRNFQAPQGFAIGRIICLLSTFRWCSWWKNMRLTRESPVRASA